eukprot:GGOE01036163.1.p1 GENE.GGOE01036163.1~~GGOE01036163.1.p1  ORF type:complete len:236 (-),score=94.50 GGOE01036163.1:378-1055(-)
MPKVKKEKRYNFGKVKAKGKDGKDSLIDNVREAVDDFDHCYVYEFTNFRMTHMKELRAMFADSRFFQGKNKVMQVALGRNAEESYAENTYKLSMFLRGFCGLFFTNRDKREVKDFFKNWSAEEFAAMGDIADRTITLPKGPLNADQFPVTMDPYLRKLGLNTKVERGVIHLLEDKPLAVEGEPLTAEGSRLLKMLGHKISVFRINLTAHWSKQTGTARRIKASDE